MKKYKMLEKFMMHEFQCEIDKGQYGYYVNIRGHNNEEIFKHLGITDRYKYASNLFNRQVKETGQFPYCDTIKECNKIIHALINYNSNPDIIEEETYTNF